MTGVFSNLGQLDLSGFNGILTSPAAQIGLNILGQMQGPTVQEQPVLGGLARGTIAGLQSANQFQNNALRNQILQENLDLRRQSFQAQREASAQKQADLAAFVQGLPEDQRAAARVNPGAAVQSQFREPTSLVQNAIAAGLVPGTPEFNDFVREGAVRPQTQVNVESNIPPAEKEEQKAIGKFRAKRFVDITEAASQSRQSDAKLDRFEQLSQRIETGRATPAQTTAKAVARSLGVNLSDFGLDDNVGAAEAINQLNVQFALDNIQGTKGAVSDNEMRLFSEAAPGLARTPEGNNLIIEVQRKINQRQREVAKLARDYRRQNGSLDEGFDDVLDRLHAENPLFTEDLTARMQAASQPATQRFKYDPNTGTLTPQ